MTQPDLFDVGERQKLPQRPATPATLGSGPEGATCGQCKHRIQVLYHDKRYPKCEEARSAWTHGEASDVKHWWPACREFEPKEKP